MSDSDVKERKPIAKLDLMLDPVADRQTWILSMQIEAESTTWSATVPIGFFNPNGLFSGTADYHIEDTKARSVTFEADIEGETFDTTVHMDLYVATRSHREVVATFSLDGGKDNDVTYTGQFHAPCRAPDTCGCDGFDGPFQLTKETN